MKKLTWLVVVIIVVILLLAFGRRSSNEAIKIGYVGSLTGDLQTWGEESRNSVALAVKEINASGGIDGKPIQVIYEDGACNGAKAVTSAKKLIDVDKVKIIITWCSQEAMSIAPVAAQSKVIEFVSAATAPELTNINDYHMKVL